MPVPNHVVFNAGEDNVIDEQEEYLEVNGKRVEKPLVEKPVSGEDHNIYLYYPRSLGGGSKRLFRKVGDKSSDFYPEVHTTRVGDGNSYIYEELLQTEGTDVKVCAARAHAHAYPHCCICTTCALRVHCMCTACALHVHCMCTACAGVHHRARVRARGGAQVTRGRRQGHAQRARQGGARFPVILTHCTWIHTVAAWTTYGCSLDHIRLQVRFPVILTAEEKEIARKIVLAFGQVRT